MFRFIIRYIALLLPTLFVWWFVLALTFDWWFIRLFPQFSGSKMMNGHLLFYSGLIVNFFVTKYVTKEISKLKLLLSSPKVS